MATYLVIQSAGQTRSYTCQTTHNTTPYLKVSNSYLDLTTKTYTGVRLKVMSNNVAYYPVIEQTATRTYTQQESQTYYTSSDAQNPGISSTTALTRSSSYYTSSVSKNAGISSTTEITITTNKKVRSITGTVNNLTLTTYGNWQPDATSIGKTTKSASELAQKYSRWTYTPSLTTASGSTRYYFNQLSSSFSEYITVAQSYTYTTGVQRRWSDYYTSQDWVADSNIPAYMTYVGLRYTFDKLYVSRSSTSKTARASLMTQTRRQWADTVSSKTFSYLTYDTAYKTVASNAASNTNWVGSTYLTETAVSGRSSRESTSGYTGRSSKYITVTITETITL